MNAVRLGVDSARPSADVHQAKRFALARLHGEAHVLLDRESAEQVGDLERAADAGARDVLRLAARRPAVPATVTKPASGGNMPDNEIERGGLAGAVRADQRVQRAIRHDDVDVRDRADAAEALGKLARDQHRAFGGLRAASASGSGASCAISRADIAAASTSRLRNGASTRSATPTRPVGENTMKPTNSRPKNRSQFGGPDREEFAEQDEEQRAERRPEERAHAADDDHRQQLAGELPPRSARRRRSDG